MQKRHQSYCQLRRWWAISGLVLLAATGRLWTPQAVFPQVPLFRWVLMLPNAVDWCCCGSLILALIVAATHRPDHQSLMANEAASVPWSLLRYSRSRLRLLAWPLFSVACVGSVVIDQHRLQPWAWLLLLMSLMFQGDTSSGRWHVRWLGTLSVETLLRWLTISVYFWSAMSKIDHTFFVTHGPTMIDALFGSVGIVGLPGAVKWWLAITLPMGELLIAVGLGWPRSRHIALWGAITLHVALILALGPLGLGHRPGVLLWNAAFIGHDWLLFRRRETTDSEGDLLTSFARPGIVLFAMLWPITESIGLCDHWLAWSVYSTRTERVSIMLTDEGVRRLPEAAQRCVISGELPLDRWSIDSLDVPIYPQLRFQLGIVEWLRQRCSEENVLEVTIMHPGSRLQGSVATEFVAIVPITHQLEQYWMNGRPKIE
jgi:hypothetical protein